jgi:ligand-binding sensor domain-containing protein
MKHIMLKTIWIIFFLVIPVAVIAQTSEKEVLHFKNYTIEDGLSDNRIRDISQDQQGYLWVATRSGVSLFDGYSFEIFRNDPDDKNSLSDNNVNDVFADLDNTVWIATVSGLNRYDRGSNTFTHFFHKAYDEKSILSNDIKEIYQSKNGSLWFSSAQGISRYNNDSQTFEHFIPSPKENIKITNDFLNFPITESEDGKIWFVTYRDGLHNLNPETGELTSMRHDPKDPQSLPSNNIFNLFIDRDQVLWVAYDRRINLDQSLPNLDVPIGSNSGLWKKDLKSGTITHYSYHPEKGHPLWEQVSDIKQTEDGKIWFTILDMYFADSFRFYDHRNDQFLTYTYKPNDPNSHAWNYCTSIFEDQFNNLWLGTSRGLSRADRKRAKMGGFSPNPSDANAFENLFYGIEEIGENIFLVSRESQSPIIWNRITDEWKVVPNISPTSRSAIYDGKRSVWNLSIQNELELIDVTFLKKESFIPDKTKVENVALFDFVRFSDDALYLTSNRNFLRFDIPKRQFEEVSLISPFGSIETFVPDLLTVEKPGTIWLSGSNALLDSITGERGILLAQYEVGSGEIFFPEINDAYVSALGTGTANHLFIDSNGELWISKTNGLVRFDPDSRNFTVYNQKNGLRYINVLGVIEDEYGMIWLSTEYGISRLNPKTDKVRNFGKTDGLRPSRLNPNSFLNCNNGELLFGGVGGLSFFHPKDLLEQEKPPLIHIVKFMAGKTRIELSTTNEVMLPVDIPWASNAIDIEYVSVNFRYAKETNYAYRLEGYQEDWVNNGSRRFVQFSNLAPGTYTFHVKAINIDGISSLQPSTFSFRILPPWWRTWWAVTLYALIFLAVLVANLVGLYFIWAGIPFGSKD